MSQVRIEICGSIASGKTTLASRLSPAINGNPIFEDFRANPFWRRFYEQPKLFRPEKDVCFLAQHTGEIKAAGDGIAVCDYAPIQDLAYARLGSDASHYRMMRIIYRQLYKSLPPPTMIVHLKCNTDELLRRIRNRGRAEEQIIDGQYLEQLETSLTQLLHRSTIPVFSLRSDEVDFLSDGEQTQGLYISIFRAVSERASRVRSLDKLESPHD